MLFSKLEKILPNNEKKYFSIKWVDLFEIYSYYISVDLYNYAVSSNVSLYILLLCQKFLYSIKRAWSAKSFSSQLHHKQKKN